MFLHDEPQGFVIRSTALGFGSTREGSFFLVFFECHAGKIVFKYGKASAIRNPARLLCELEKTIIMATGKHKNAKDPNSSAYDQAENAHDQAEKDMEKDPELSDPDPTDDLDEGELARRDNSDEEALDYLERPRHGVEGHAKKGHGEKEHGEKGHEEK